MKTHDHDAHAAQRRAVAQQAEHGEAATQLAHAGADTFDHRVNHSPRLVAQRQLLSAAFGPALQQPVQREAGLDDEEPAMQAKQEAPAEANLTGIPNQLKSGVEALSGMDMSDVRVHLNSDKPAQLNALAYAQGNEIHLGPGQEQHLPHEAWHVVQQRQGRVQATMQMAGLGVNDDVGLEREADLMGEKAEGGLVQLKEDGRKQDLALDRSPEGRTHDRNLEKPAQLVGEDKKQDLTPNLNMPARQVVQLTAAQDLQAAQQNQAHFLQEVQQHNQAGTTVHTAVTNTAAGAAKNDAADGLRTYWQTVEDGFDGKKAELYEAELIASNNHVPILGSSNTTDPDVRYTDGSGTVHATEVKTVNSDVVSSVNRVIKDADAQLARRVANDRIVKIRLESEGNLWPSATHAHWQQIQSNADLNAWLLQPGIVPEFANANEFTIEGINAQYSAGQKRNFSAAVKGDGLLRKRGAKVS